MNTELRKAFDYILGQDYLEKGKLDTANLHHKFITDKLGHQRNVWVKNEDNSFVLHHSNITMATENVYSDKDLEKIKNKKEITSEFAKLVDKQTQQGKLTDTDQQRRNELYDILNGLDNGAFLGKKKTYLDKRGNEIKNTTLIEYDKSHPDFDANQHLDKKEADFDEHTKSIKSDKSISEDFSHKIASELGINDFLGSSYGKEIAGGKKEGSFYLQTKDGITIRISDHDLPEYHKDRYYKDLDIDIVVQKVNKPIYIANDEKDDHLVEDLQSKYNSINKVLSDIVYKTATGKSSKVAKKKFTEDELKKLKELDLLNSKGKFDEDKSFEIQQDLTKQLKEKATIQKNHKVEMFILKGEDLYQDLMAKKNN